MNQNNKTVLYFRNKNYGRQTYSSEIFDNIKNNPMGIRFPKITNNPLDAVKIKQYHNIDDILNDEDFIICTKDSFTYDELHMIQDIIYAHGRHIYGDEKTIKLVRKIENMLIEGRYLPEDETSIIKK